MELFDNHPDIDAIVVVYIESWIEVLKIYRYDISLLCRFK